MTRVLGIVPARGGSKRLPGKNLRQLSGKPLVAWALEAALGASSLDQIALSSDDERILAVGSAYPRVHALTRPAEISDDHAPAIAYVRHALERLADSGPFDAVVIVQPSSPFTLSSDIDAVARLLFESMADSAVSVMPVDHAIHPIKLKRLVGDRLEPYFDEEAGRMSEHELPRLYVRNGSVYASRVSTIDRGSILGSDSRGFAMPRERSIDINDELDFAFAEFMAARRSFSEVGPKVDS